MSEVSFFFVCAKGNRESWHRLPNSHTSSLFRILLPSQAKFAEESIPYFDLEQNVKTFETANRSDKNWKKNWLAFMREHFEILI